VDPTDPHNRRRFDRKKRRIPCQLWVGEREHSALVLDLSPSGLFVQTHAKVQCGERLAVRLSYEGAGLDLVVEVARTKPVPANLLTVAKGGIGVRIVSAPEEYFQLLDARLSERSTSEVELVPEREPGSHFRVYVAQISGSRSRRLEIAAPNGETAATRALEELGDGWKILRIEPA
jgi:hypothetical protein